MSARRRTPLPDGSVRGGTDLATYLRNLRLSHWPDAALTQPHLAGAFGVAVSSISSWETDPTKIPPRHRLDAYARFFATRRSWETSPPRLLAQEELTDDERLEHEKLSADLIALHVDAVARTAGAVLDRPRTFWRFEDDAPVRILCGALAQVDRPPFAAVENHNYMALSSFADQDSLVELFGHLRMENPDSDVRFVRADHFSADDLKSHVVVLGNMAQMQGEGRVVAGSDIPVRQIKIEGLDGEVFVDDSAGRQFGPQLSDTEPTRVIEDVGFVARTPNPHFSATTLTVCSGVFTRGVYGAVRCLTDKGLRADNERYLHERFADAPSFGVLMRVPVADHTVPTPELLVGRNRLFEFP